MGSVVSSSVIHVANDAEQFAVSMRPNIEHTIIGRGVFGGTVTHIDFHRLWMQRGRSSLSSIGHGHQPAGRTGIMFSTGAVVWKGVEMAATDVALVCDDQPFWWNMAGPSQWSSMSLPVDDLPDLAAAMLGHDLNLASDGLTMKTTPACHARLLRLHAAACHLAEDAPDIIDHPAASCGLEHALIEAMVDCMAASDVRSASTAWRQRTAIMKRFRTALEANIEEPAYVPEICQAIGVPERTLRKHCQEHLGMSPKKYLLLRRMNLAHRALCSADPSTTTVTEVATRFGFWELGRFAVEYRAWCGESPSASLSRAPA